MNLFSQSKLTLKLKKQNSAPTNDFTNKFQNPEISDSLKTEFLSNNSDLSENDSFVEILHSAQTNEEKIPTSQNIFKTTLSDQNTSNIVYENKQCPVCLQTVDEKHFIIHVKSCGTSHKLSSKTLIKAVDLQERQAAEREALGLPKLIKSKDVKKKKCNKQTKLKIGSDSNLDLAIAMSVSLQESKNAEIIQESNTLLEAGLEKEALEKRNTLENFGFISNQTVKSKPKSFSKTNSLLFKQTKDDREKRITEKVAMILIDVDAESSSELLVNHCPNTKLVSKYLKTIRNIDNKLWKKSLLEEENICEFYVKQLSKFIKPCKSNRIIGLQNDDIFSTHHSTLRHESNMIDEEFTDILQIAVDNSNVDSIPTPSYNIVANKTMWEYSSKWKSMIGNQFMSDFTIFTKDEHEIPAHTLVFYVQFPDILNDIVTEESDSCKSKKMLMWLEYSYEACLAFLELIYSGQESVIKHDFREDYLHLGKRYNILMALNDGEKQGGFTEEADIVSKRKSSELYNPYDSKRYKASSPDMFMSDDMSEVTCTSANFLGTTVNDEKSSSFLNTKQWLDSQNLKSSFTENLVISQLLPSNTIEKSPCHSFHSASTISLNLTYLPNYNSDSENNDIQIESSPDINISLPNPLLTDESNIKSISVLQNIKSVTIDSTPSKITKSIKEPEFITIDTDSENESIDIILSNSIKRPGQNNTFLSRSSIKNGKQNLISYNSSNSKCGHLINTIELNDNSSDSIYSVGTCNNCNILHQRNYNTKSNHSLFHGSISNSKDKKKNVDDRSSIFSAVTNVLPLNYESTQIFSSNNNFIDLIECSSSDSVSIIDMTSVLKNSNNSRMSIPTSLNRHNDRSSTSFSNIMTSIKENISLSESDFTTKYEANNLTWNSSPFESNIRRYSFPKNDEGYFTSSNKKTNNNFDLNSSNSLSYSILPENKVDSKLLSNSPKRSLHLGHVSSEFFNTTSHIKKHDSEENVKSIDRIFSNDQNILEKSNLDSKQLENIVMTSSILPTNNFNDSYVNNKEMNDLTFFSLSEGKNKHLINTTNPQVEPNQLSKVITSGVTIPNENDHELNKSNIEQIIDDPWMDYNDYQEFNLSPQYISPVLSECTSIVDESKVQTPRKKYLDLIHMNLVTPSTTSYNCNTINSKKKNSLTPNKYSTRISTPKSLRRVQSESIIGSKQVTPLADYSSMKTPDLRKEFDRYGLKDLGRRKGKLILRHIYDILHPSSEEDNLNIEYEQFSSSSDISEYGIPDYEDGSYDELETFNPTNLSNKISVEAGFKQLLRTNEDLHNKILCYEPIWIEELKEDLKQQNVNISMQKLMTFLDDKCVTFRSKSLNDQRQKTLAKKNSKRKKLF